MKRKRGRWQLNAAVAVCLVVAAAVAMVAFFLLPPRAELGRADVVVVLAGADDGRHALGRQLIEEGRAENLVVSNPNGEREIVGSSLCRGANRPKQAETRCMMPSPVTTTGEALTFELIAQEEGWDTAIVVTNRPHTRRARMNFEECSSVATTVVNIDRVVWQYVLMHAAREVGGFIKHYVNDPC